MQCASREARDFIVSRVGFARRAMEKHAANMARIEMSGQDDMKRTEPLRSRKTKLLGALGEGKGWRTDADADEA